MSVYADNMEPKLNELLESIESVDPATGLRAAAALHRLAEKVEEKHVKLARRQGWSWELIGDALGVSRQSAHKKHAKK
ncbi:MAG: hypothetical protein WB822_12145 [Rhodoplanes sp.]